MDDLNEDKSEFVRRVNGKNIYHDVEYRTLC